MAKFNQLVGLLTTLVERLIILLEETHSYLDSSLAMPLADSYLLFINGHGGLEFPFLDICAYINRRFLHEICIIFHRTFIDYSYC